MWSVLAIVPEGGSLQHWESVPSLVHLITISPSQCTFSWGDKLHLHCAMVLHLTSESLPIVHLHFQTSLQSNSPLYSNVHCTALRLRKAAPSPFFLCQRGWSRQGDNCETTDRADCETIYRAGTRGSLDDMSRDIFDHHYNFFDRGCFKTIRFHGTCVYWKRNDSHPMESDQTNIQKVSSV